MRVHGLHLDPTDEQVAVQRRILLEGEDDEEERLRMASAFDAMTLPDSMPAVSDLMVDDAGRAWVRAYDPALGDDVDWTIYDRDGLPVAAVRLPPGLDPLHLGEDFVLGVRRDELDVEYVERYALERPGG